MQCCIVRCRSEPGTISGQQDGPSIQLNTISLMTGHHVPSGGVRQGRHRQIDDVGEHLGRLGQGGQEGDADRMRSEARFHQAPPRRSGPAYRSRLCPRGPHREEEAGGCHRHRNLRDPMHGGRRPRARDRLRRSRHPHHLRHPQEAGGGRPRRGRQDLRRPRGRGLRRIRRSS